MKLYHWLGKDAEQYEEAIACRKAYYNDRQPEGDGFITLHPELSKCTARRSSLNA